MQEPKHPVERQIELLTQAVELNKATLMIKPTYIEHINHTIQTLSKYVKKLQEAQH